MNALPENIQQTSYQHKIGSISTIASAISALLLSSCADHNVLDYQVVNPSVVYNPLPYRPLSEFRKNTPQLVEAEELEKWKQLRNFMTDSSLVPAEEEFVDDNGNIFIREQLESCNE